MLSDRHLSQRLERTEALANAAFVEARAELQPEVGACWKQVAGAVALFDGKDSPCTQTFCLGIFQTPLEQHFEEIEQFYRSRGAAVHHEVSPLVEKSVLHLLAQRRYRPIEVSQVMYLPLATRAATVWRADHEMEVEHIHADEETRALYARTAAAGWNEYSEFAGLIESLSLVGASKRGSHCFLARIGGVPAATGSMNIHEGVALLAGASTVPVFRNRGAQSLLLEARLRHAQQLGCDLAMICAEPGSASARNAERRGFRVAYTRIKWEQAG